MTKTLKIPLRKVHHQIHLKMNPTTNQLVNGKRENRNCGGPHD